MTVILGPSRQFIRMEQSGFNVEQNQNVWTLHELHKTLVKCKDIISPLFTNTYALVTQIDTFLLPHTARATSHADKFFTSKKSFFCSAVPPVAPFVGASDIGQGYYGPKNMQSGLRIKPRTPKKIVLWGQGFKPRTCKTSCAGGIWKHMQNTQVISIGSMSVGCQTMARLLDDVQANQKNRWWTDRPKNDASVQKDMFPAEHIFFGNTSCTKFV